MLGTELAYVREQLKRCDSQERAAIAKAIRVSQKTILRIAERRTKHPSSFTVGRLALHFKTREKRAETA